MKKATLLSLITLFLALTIVTAQERIAVLQDPFVVLLDATDGSIVDPSFIDLSSLNPSTPKAILQVGNQIWIADQIADRIDRFDLNGVYQSTIASGLDNIRGLENVNGEVWVTNAGTNNGAPGNAVVRFSPGGTNLGFFLTSGSDSVFDILDVGNNEVYLSYIFGESKIERRDYAGTVLGNVVEEGVVSFIQQMELNPANNSVYASVFSVSGANSSGLYEFEIATGNILNYYAEGNLRGVALLGDGNVLVSNAAGVRIVDPGTSGSTIVNSDSSQYFGRLTLTPCTPPATPTGDAAQTFNDGATLSDIVVTPSTVSWFATLSDAQAGTNSLPLSTVLLDQATYYAVNIVNSCLSEPFAVTVTIVLRVEDVLGEKLVIFPNPAKQQLFIESGFQIDEIQVFSITGKKILEAAANSDNTAVDVSMLPNGTYVLIVISEGNKQHRKFLIAR